MAHRSEVPSQRVSKKLKSTGTYDLFVLTIISSRWSGFLFVQTYLTLLKELLFWDLPFLILFKELIIQNQDLKVSIGEEQSQRQKPIHFCRPPFLPADTCWQGRRWELSWRHLLPSQPSLLRSSWKSENNRRDQNLDYFLNFKCWNTNFKNLFLFFVPFFGPAILVWYERWYDEISLRKKCLIICLVLFYSPISILILLGQISYLS